MEMFKERERERERERDTAKHSVHSVCELLQLCEFLNMIHLLRVGFKVRVLNSQRGKGSKTSHY